MAKEKTKPKNVAKKDAAKKKVAKKKATEAKTKAKPKKKASEIKGISSEELALALKVADQKKVTPAIKKRVDRLVKLKGIPVSAAITFVYYGGPRVDQ